MASISDVFDALNDVKGKLDQLHVDGTNNGLKIDATNGKLDTVNAKLDVLNTTVTNVGAAVDARFNQVLQQQQLSNQLVHHLTRQQETVICILEHISQNTCELVNLETKELQATLAIQEHSRMTAEILRGAYPNAALDLVNRDELANKIKECCPDEVEPPPCQYKACENPGPFQDRRRDDNPIR
jgi:predicted nuclease with TOPRIM domain